MIALLRFLPFGGILTFLSSPVGTIALLGLAFLGGMVYGGNKAERACEARIEADRQAGVSFDAQQNREALERAQAQEREADRRLNDLLARVRDNAKRNPSCGVSGADADFLNGVSDPNRPSGPGRTPRDAGGGPGPGAPAPGPTR